MATAASSTAAAAGTLCGSRRRGLEFSAVIPAITGLMCTLLCLVVFGRENFLIPAMILITLALTLLRSREEAKA